MTANYKVCNCMNVKYADIVDALQKNNKFDDVLTAFDDVQKATNCSTGCGGCYSQVLDIISSVLNGAEV